MDLRFIYGLEERGVKLFLAGEAMAGVQTPTLLLADAEDPSEVTAARAAAAHLSSPHRIHRVRNGAAQSANWAATSAICRWMEWHLVDLEVLSLRSSRMA